MICFSTKCGERLDICHFITAYGWFTPNYTLDKWVFIILVLNEEDLNNYDGDIIPSAILIMVLPV